MTSLITSGALLLLLALGTPIAFALIVSSVFGLYLIGGLPVVLGLVGTTTVSAGSNYELLAIPMFILMAEFIIVSKIADDLFESAAIWVGRLPGGLAVATVLGGALFGAISGSSAAAAVTLSGTSLPAMIKKGFTPQFAGGVVVVSGLLDMLIPPSIALIFFGLVADQSIRKLLIAGLVPGLIVASVLVAYIMTVSATGLVKTAPGQRYSFREKFTSVRSTGPILLLLAVVTFSLYSGIATPTESSAVGAFGAFVIAVAKRRLNTADFFAAVTRAAHTSCMIGLLLLGGYLFSYFFVMTQTAQLVATWVGDLHASPLVTLALLGLIYLVLGTFLDTVAMIILTVPIVLPIIVNLGYDPIWFGIILVMVAQVGILTPPTGMNVYIVAKYANRPAHEIFIGVFPYVILITGVIVVFTMWPEIVLWLPNMI